MTEKYQPIPHRLKNMAVGGHVAGAVDILDDNLNRNQQDINADTYRKGEVYNKEETNNIISRTPETDVVPLVVPEGSTAADVLDEVPVADRPNKLFRVINDDNTAFSEYGWTGSEWAVLANKDYGFDINPKRGSVNLMQSKDLFKFFSNSYNGNDIGFVLSGEFNEYLLYIKNQMLYSKLGLSIDGDIEGNKVTLSETNIKYITSSNRYNFVVVDMFGAFVIACDDNGVVVHEDTSGSDAEKVYNSYKSFESILDAACVLGIKNANTERYFQLSCITDTHENSTVLEHQNILENAFETFDACVHLGDIVTNSTRTKTATYIERYFDTSQTNKPRFFCVGNHETGTYSVGIDQCLTRQEVYDICTSKMVELNYLNNGEYTSGKNYYYHDFTSSNYKVPVRLIVLDQYDFDSTFCTDYWEPITYSDSYDTIAKGQYSTGDCVNVSNYTDYSFRAVQDVNVPKSSIYDSKRFWPRYNEFRFGIWYSQAQLEWFAAKVKEAAVNGYVVITCAHHGISTDKTPLYNYEFCPNAVSPTVLPVTTTGNNERLSDLNKNIISDILYACKTKTTISRHISAVAPVTKYFSSDDYTLTENIDNFPEFDFSYDFSDIDPSTSPLETFHISGHSHRDGVCMNAENGLLEFMFVADSPTQGGVRDTRASHNKNSSAYDSITALTVREDMVHVCRIGATVANKIRNNKLMYRDNEFIMYNNNN